MRAARLYRCPTKTDYLCPCGDAARRLRKLGYAVEELRVARRRSQRPEIEDLTGQDRVPVVVFDDGEKLWDSRRIREHLRFREGT